MRCSHRAWRMLVPISALAALVALPGLASAQVAWPPAQPVGPIFVATQQLLADTGFENTAVATTPITPSRWVRAGAMVLSTTRPHCGARSLATGGSFGGGGFAYQTVTVTGAQPIISLYLDAITGLTSSSAVDTLTLSIHNSTTTGLPGTTVLATLATFSNLDAPAATFARKGNFDVSAFRGQTVQVWLTATINSEIATAQNLHPITTNFYVDDLTLWTESPLFINFC
jgi:hypothetical protein